MSLHHLSNRFMVIPLHFEIADRSISLRGFDARMPQKILDGDQVSIGIEQLCGHRVP
jgi:hypothetical protein